MALLLNTLFESRRKALDKLYSYLIESRLSREKLGAYVFGVSGIGKKFFIDQLGEKIKKETRYSLWIRPWRESFSKTPAEWIRDFTCGTEVSDKYLETLYKKFRKNIFERITSIPNQNQLLDTWLDFWLNALYTDILTVVRMGNNINTKHVNLIFALDNIDTYFPIIQQRLQHVLLPELKGLKGMWNVHCILSGIKPIDQVLTVNSNLTNVIELLQLEPVTLAEVKKCLLPSQTIRDEKLLEMLKISQGIPQRLIESLSRFLWGPIANQVDLESLSGVERQLLVGLMYLRHFEIGDLELFLQEGTKTEDALKWLIKLPFLKRKTEGEVYHIDNKIANQLIEHHQVFYPQENDILALKVKTFLAVREKIPKLKDRLQLLTFSEINYFNEKLLEEFYANEAKDILKWVTTHGEWFVKASNFTWTLSSEYRYWINLYRSILPKNSGNSVRVDPNRLFELWELHKLECESTIKVKLNENQQLRLELKHIRGQLEAIHQNIAKKLQQLDAAKNVGNPLLVFGSSSVAFFMILMGVVLLYMGVLFTQQFPLVCSVGGLFLIATGFLLPYGKQKKIILEQQERAKNFFEQLKKQFFDLKVQRDYCLIQMRQFSTKLLALEQEIKDLKQRVQQPYVLEKTLEQPNSPT